MSDTLRNVKIKYGIDLSQYTTATTKLKQEQTKIETAFRESANAMDNWQSTSQGLASRVSSLSEKIRLQKDVLANLKAQYDAVSTAAGADSAAAVKLQQQYNKASVELDKMNSDLSNYRDKLYQAATAEGKTADQAKAMGGQIQNAGTKTNSFKDKIKEFAKSSVGQFTSVASAVALAVQAIKKIGTVLNDATNWADDINTLSNQTNIATSELQSMAYAARFVDVEVETMQKGLSRVVMAINEAKAKGDDYIETAGGLQVSLKDANGELKDSEQLFYDAIDAIGGLANETEREAAAQDIFGRSYQDLMPLVKAGSDAIEKYGEEAKTSGAVVDNVTIAALQRLDDKFEETAAITESKTKQMASTMIRAADLGASAWQKLWGEITNYPNNEMQKYLYVLTGSKEKAQEMVATYQEYDLALYASGLSQEDFKTKLQETTNYLITQGVPAEEAQSQALALIAEGYDGASSAAAQMETALEHANETINAAADAYVAKWTEYQQAVKASAEDYKSDLGGIFDAFDAELADSQEALDAQSEQLLNNLQSQVDGIQGWSEEIAALAKRGIDQGLLQELRDMGPEAYAQVQALNNMTDSQLKEYSGLYRKMGTEVTNAAKDANAGLARETEKALLAAQTQANNQTVKMKALGVNLGKGLGDGMDLSSSYITNKLQDVIDKAISSAKKKYDIHSPSRVTAELLGDPLGAGVGVGWADSLKDITPRIESAMRDVTSKLAASAYQITASPISYVTSAASAGSVSTINNSHTGPLISIGQYVQNTDDDINALGYKLALAQQRAAAAIGG